MDLTEDSVHVEDGAESCKVDLTPARRQGDRNGSTDPAQARRSRGISRSAVNVIVDAALLSLFGGVVFSTCVLRFVFPAGPAARDWSLWGLRHEAWLNVHVAAVATFAGGVLLHLILHWSWVCGFVCVRLTRVLGRPVVLNDGTRTLYGVGLLIVAVSALVGLLGLAVVMVPSPS